MKQKRLLSGLFIAMFVWTLTGCAILTPPRVAQQNLLVECPELPDLPGTTGADVLSTMIKWGGLYLECKTRHAALIDAVD